MNNAIGQTLDATCERELKTAPRIEVRERRRIRRGVSSQAEERRGRLIKEEREPGGLRANTPYAHLCLPGTSFKNRSTDKNIQVWEMCRKTMFETRIREMGAMPWGREEVV